MSYKIIAEPDQYLAGELRGILCSAAANTLQKPPGWNPLSETKFNELLKQLAQRSFEEGMRFQEILTKGKQ